MKKFIWLIAQFILVTASAQKLHSGFDKAEYAELMKLNTRTSANPKYYDLMPGPED